MANEFNADDLLAFVHIEKAAGTTFIHILRRNFFLRYLDVRPYGIESGGLFLSGDLRISTRILPGLKCFSGHAVTPYSDLGRPGKIKYITIMRDPVKRYLSQYQHWIEKKGLDVDFEDFLEIEELSNFQTRKYAGRDDLDEAKRRLQQEFLLVGYVEAYDEFLVLLRNRLAHMGFCINYEKQNLARNLVPVDTILKEYSEQIVERNLNDIALYQFVKDELFPGYKQDYPGDFQADFNDFIESKDQIPFIQKAKSYLDYAFRKGYVEPVTGMIRLANGKPYKGSY
ncbi:MAG TPA: sulfotransferase family 2 domain-containing protein [Pseudomonadales bacterium]|jgi:hypothetical protein|nr:sulfotransferase family 2 domain-containing protein [Pseudomonadales bacterium]HMW82105.1 sulfotransferase family 2 domain-containing protein [Pseudomonadales bacterium]HMY97877.1 sulfotransferase family 2 domain-containing protein [Pseudomonadales bacterium]HMZ71864.1 sulfotransferase family 2 domain-containing protein [Pseudomonadales bacterium]HNC75822.1 sulfotransferase family 2 domain-containing protein [Pseudomonadales bacterium]